MIDMSIDGILQTVTILKDCTSANIFDAMLILLGLAAVSFSVSFFIMRFSESFIREKICTIIVAVICIFALVLNVWLYIKRPVFIDFYISTNGIEIQQLNEYFEVSEISEIGNTTVCHIEPKFEYYDDTMIYWYELHLNPKK